MGAKGHCNITYEERRSIQILLESGWTMGGIASQIGRSHSGIKAEVRRNGGRQGYNAEKAHKAYQAAQIARITKVQKGISPEQLKVIELGMSRGDSMNRISINANVSHFLLSRYFREHGHKVPNKNYTSFIERIENIEQQIEIIFSVLESLEKK